MTLLQAKMREVIVQLLEDVQAFSESDLKILAQLKIAVTLIQNTEFEKIKDYYREHLLQHQKHFENRNEEIILNILGSHVSTGVKDFFKNLWFGDDEECFLEEEKERIWNYADAIIEYALEIEKIK